MILKKLVDGLLNLPESSLEQLAADFPPLFIPLPVAGRFGIPFPLLFVAWLHWKVADPVINKCFGAWVAND